MSPRVVSSSALGADGRARGPRFAQAFRPAAPGRRRAGAGLVGDVRRAGHGRDGSVLETGRGNLFVVTDDAVLTPMLDGRMLPGVTRQRAIDVLEAAGIPVLQRRLSARRPRGRHRGLRHELAGPGAAGDDRRRGRSSGPSAGRPNGWLSRLGPPPQCRTRARRAGGPTTVSLVRLRLLLIDNYDSFVYNLDQYVGELGAGSRGRAQRRGRRRRDRPRRRARRAPRASSSPQARVLRPSAGLSMEVVERLGRSVPILGVCLGHQCIAAAYGARIVRAGTIVHGKPSLVHHDGLGVYAGLDGPLVAGRYHSLVVSEQGLPSELVVTARTGNGVVMGLRHREHPVEGVQFHPESILSHQRSPPAGHLPAPVRAGTPRHRQTPTRTL